MSHFEKAKRTDKTRVPLGAHNCIWPAFGYLPYYLSADFMGLPVGGGFAIQAGPIFTVKANVDFVSS